MFKTVRTKLNKKGFTLAELLVVVAIIAVLVAIAIPIFTSQLDRAQRAVNQANARSIKGIAATEVLAEWDKLGKGAEHAAGKPGWIAVGHVTAAGAIESVKVYVVSGEQTSGTWVTVADKEPKFTTVAADTSNVTVEPWAPADANEAVEVDSSLAKHKPAHYIVVTIDDVQKITAGAGT